jgi:hypothetical protein
VNLLFTLVGMYCESFGRGLLGRELPMLAQSVGDWVREMLQNLGLVPPQPRPLPLPVPARAPRRPHQR